MTWRQALRIGRWELVRSVGQVDRSTAIVMAVAVLAVGIGGVTVADRVGSADTGIYRVSVAPESPYYSVAVAGDRFRPVPLEEGVLRTGGAELVVRDGTIRHADSRISRAALSAFREALAAYNDRRLADEPDQAAAFPVRVELTYRDRSFQVTRSDRDPTDDENDTGNGTTAADGDGRGGAGDGLGGLIDRLRSSGRALFGAGQRGTPSEITPPFPMRSLLIAFAFLVPLNPVAQAYGSSVMGERIQRRGESLLVSPVNSRTIVAGKTLPYAAVSLLITGVIAFVIGGSPITVLAIVPITAVFLGATFLGALFARSFTELSFLTLTVSVVVTAYAFVPAIFTDVHPIAGISPLSIVVRDLTGAPIAGGRVAFATIPLTVVALVLFGAGINIYREEDLFTQRPPPAKALDALAARLSLRLVPVWAALTLPFVFVAELFAIAILFVAPPSVAIPALLAAIAVIEEVAKSLPALAGFARNRFPTRLRTALLAGLGAGLGFAIGEKAFLAAQLVGLPSLELGRLAFSPIASASPVTAVLLALAPGAMHAVTATLSAVGASRSTEGYLVGLTAAIAIHLLYNAAVVTVLV